MSVIRSRDNPRLRRWQRLLRSRHARRRERRALIEGVHLVQAYLQAHGTPECLIVSESGLRRAEIASLVRNCEKRCVVLADGLFATVADSEAPTGVAAEIAIAERAPDLARAPACILLDGIQDAGNVGAILRSAAAFDLRDVVLGAGCADPWSPKVLRAGMGAHFALHLASGCDLLEAARRFGGTLACTVVRGGASLAQIDLRGRLGWIFGGEGQGVSAALAERASLRLTIPMPGSAESLNVAAAAAVCFYERSRQLSTPAVRS